MFDDPRWGNDPHERDDDSRERDSDEEWREPGHRRDLGEQGLINTARLDGQRDVAVVLTDRGRALLESHRGRDHDPRQEFYSGLKRERTAAKWARYVSLMINRATVVESGNQPMLPSNEVLSVYSDERGAPDGPRAATLIIAFIATLASTSCARESPYFGKVEPPSGQRLVFEMSSEPASLDPAKTDTTNEIDIAHAMLEGLTRNHPKTVEPMAGLATHYAVSDDGRIYTFYLRGHPQPAGTRLPNTDTLRQEFEAGKLPEDLTHGSAAPPDNVPARWSDGKIITASDFVYSWRREVNPATAAHYATYLYAIRNAKEINQAKKPPETLGVEAVDDFTLRVELKGPVAYFLKIVATEPYSAVPGQAIEAARAQGQESGWTRAGSLVSNGAFRLREWRPYDKIVLQKNPAYYEAGLVRLEEITFLLVYDRNTNMNLYRAGVGHFLDPFAFEPAYLPVLRKKNDYQAAPLWGIEHYKLRVTNAPLNDVRVRYALNMAVDKDAIAEVTGLTPAHTFVPPMPGYDAPRTVPVSVEGKNYDVLSFNPAAARELLAKAGFRDGLDKDGRRLTFNLIGLDATATTELYAAQVLQQQWRKTLGVEANIVEGVGVDEMLRDSQFQGAVPSSWAADYADPNEFLEPLFVTGEANNVSGWSDPRFDALLAEANRTRDPAERQKLLTQCETEMLKAMPVIPIAFQASRYLRKPFVHGLWPDPFNGYAFQYAWIDTNWRPK